MGNSNWLSYQEQLALLQARGLLVDDESAALDYLERIGYYRLGGYLYPFRVMKSQPVGVSYREDHFLEGSHFRDGVDLYVFDKKLRLLALDALERIEMAVRVDVAYLLGKYDAFAHHNSVTFDRRFTRQIRRRNKTGYEQWLEKYESLIYHARNQDFVRHNREKYEGKLPIWVAIEIFDFGCLSWVYSGLKYKDRKTIADKYGISEDDFKSLLKGLNFIRNVSAHHSRLWNINVVEYSQNPNRDNHWREISPSRAFFYFCGMQYLLKTICPNSEWRERFLEHLESFPKNTIQRAMISDFGLTTNIESWSLWKE